MYKTLSILAKKLEIIKIIKTVIQALLTDTAAVWWAWDSKQGLQVHNVILTNIFIANRLFSELLLSKPKGSYALSIY